MRDISLTKNIIENNKNNLETNLVLLQDIISNDTFVKNVLPKDGGIYAFWWVNDLAKIKNQLKKSKYNLKGKHTVGLLPVSFSEEWINLNISSSNNDKICLYVGKTTNISQRISKHIRPKTTDIWKGNKRHSGIKPNSESQLRIGVERVFYNDSIIEFYGNIGLSYIELKDIYKYQNGINRFYLEDYFISKHYPLFNIDIER